MIKAINLSKKFVKNGLPINAINNLNLEVKDGTMTAIQGVSGSGKTTLLLLLGTLETPDIGQIYVDDELIIGMKESQLASIRARKLGFVFQHFYLINFLSVKENIEIILPKESALDERESISVDILRRVGLSHRLNHRPSELSGGEQQRVAIARALANSPQIVLADEPTGDLDSKTSHEILELIAGINNDLNTSFVIVTHDNNIIKYTHEVYWMEDGNIFSN